MEDLLINHDDTVETIFKAVEPFRKLDDGFGYIGILLRNKIEDTLQCHICGKWYKGLGVHVNQNHKINSKEYKYRFGLPLTFPLCGLNTSNAYSKNGEKNILHIKNRNPQRASKLCSSWKRKYHRTSPAFKNKIGSCDEQINQRFLIVADMIGKDPSQKDLLKHDSKLWSIIRRRHGTINRYRKTQGYDTIPRANILSREKLLGILRKFVEKTKRLPYSSDFRKGSPNVATYRNIFGSWSRALSYAGLI